MTRANQWLVFGGVLSVGAGFLGGMMFSRRGAAQCVPEKYSTYGNIYYVGDDTYLDGAAIELLTARADDTTTNEGWTIFHFHTRILYVKKFHDGPVLPEQRGAAYIRRRSITDPGQARYEEMTSAMLRDLVRFGTLTVHHWPSWKAMTEERRGSSDTGHALSSEARRQ